MKFRTLFLSAWLLLAMLPAKADEGMWLLHLLQQQNSIELMKARGLQLDARDIYNPQGASLMGAVGIFGGGCTGEVVSPNGLVLTNHHCGYGSIQSHSSVEHDYLTHGFWAATQDDELPTPGLRFRFVDRIVDVTDLVEKQVKAGEVSETEALTRPYLQRLAAAELEKSDLNGKPGIVAQAYPFYEGNKFYLVYYKVYTDVRLVGAPPQSIGKFGGETDNWMWPRHTCDFSVFRIYGDKKGNPAPYSPKNVPLATPNHLKVSIDGFDEGDYAMILGFPGSTNRYLTASEVEEEMQAGNSAMVDIRGVALEVLRKAMAGSDRVRIQYASKFAGISNYWKNSRGMNEAIMKNKVLQTKAEQEREFELFAKGKPQYEGVVGRINAIIARRLPVNRTYSYTSEALQRVIEFGSPYMLMGMMKSALQQKDKAQVESLKKQLREAFESIHNKDYDHQVDRAVAKAVLPALAGYIDDLPGFYRTIETAFNGDYDRYVDNMYDNSIFSSRANLEQFLSSPTVESIDNDPATEWSRTKNEQLDRLGETLTNLSADLDLLRKAYVGGLTEMAQPAPTYPDANFTMRLTYGNVKSYEPKDGVQYRFYTTADGVLEKEDPTNPEFVVPAKLKELIEGRDYGRYAMKNGALPACFLTTNDITGGNSGSPVMDGKGRLIGLAFDGNWESLSGDIHFDDKLQRCIAVDIRYVLFVIEKLGQCDRLIREMGL